MSLQTVISKKEAARDFIFDCARDVRVMAPMDDEAQEASWELRSLAWKVDNEINQLRREARKGTNNG